MDLLARVRAGGLLAAGRPVVVLFSGGRDSTCLLDLAARIAGPGWVTALHVNYGLREGADGDEAQCERTAAALGVPLALHRSPAQAGGNVQAWAREVRYTEATRLADERGAEIAAGHTATDQVETILYRLASSPSRRALLGMRERDGRLIRPLLRFTRAETEAHCRERGLSWRDDPSNDTSEYARSRVRWGLVPALREVHPGAEANLLAVAEQLREEHDALEALVDAWLAGAGDVALDRLRELPPALSRLVIQRLADLAAGGLAPGVGRRAPEILALGDRGTVALDLPSGIRAVAEYGRLRFEQQGTQPPPPSDARLTVPGRVRFGEHEVVCELTAPVPEPGVLDGGRLGPELLVRPWRAGDRMAPLGLGGTKSLQDLFTARRIPRRQRARIAVVEAAGEIAWVPGVAMSERFKVTPATRQGVRLSLGPPQ